MAPCCCLKLLGRGLAQLPRDQIYVATKVGKYKPGEPEDFSGERVKRSVHESLQRLGEAAASCRAHTAQCTYITCMRCMRYSSNLSGSP